MLKKNWSGLVLAACDGRDAVEGLLKNTKAVATPSAPAGTTKYAGAYITSVAVQGFRGIGPKQMLCLPSHLHGNEELAERVSYTWAALSRACHHHPYELSPTSSELLGWIGTVEELLARVAVVGAPVNRTDAGR